MDGFNQDRERARVEMLHERLKDRLSDYRSDDFEGVVLHSAGIIFAADPAVAQLFGYDVDEVLYRNVIDFFPAKSGRTMLQQMLTKSPATYTVTAMHKDGSLFQVEAQGRDFEAYGEPVRAVQVRRLTSGEAAGEQ